MINNAACPKCGELNCGFPVINAPFVWGYMLCRGLRHVVPCDREEHFIWSPHTLTLDCLCTPYMSNYMLDGEEHQLAIHCMNRVYTG